MVNDTVDPMDLSGLDDEITDDRPYRDGVFVYTRSSPRIDGWLTREYAPGIISFVAKSDGQAYDPEEVSPLCLGIELLENMDDIKRAILRRAIARGFDIRLA